MNNSKAALSSPPATPPVLTATVPRRRPSLGTLLWGNGPLVLVAAVIVVLWYAIGLFNNVPFARQTMGAQASFGDVLGTAMNLPMPFVPLPHQVLSDFLSGLNQPLDSPRGLWLHMGATGLEALLGLLAGSLLGLVIASLFVHSRPLDAAFLPYVVASQTVPVLALAPIVIAILGISLTAKVVVSAYLAFFSVTVSMVKGLKSADTLAYELLRSYAANRWQIYWKLRFPVALPYLFTGLKVAATASLVGAIIAELPFGSTTGLGARLLVATTYNLTIVWWSVMLAAAVLGIIAFTAISLLERLVVKRRPAGLGS